MESMQNKFIAECKKLSLEKMANNIFKKNIYKIAIIRGERRNIKIGFREFLFFKNYFRVKEYKI